jgi:hypothetical protein
MAMMLFIFILNGHFQMKEAFLRAYNQNGTLSEGEEIDFTEDNFEKGSNIILSIYYGLEYPISIDDIEITANADSSYFNYLIIDYDRIYKKITYINDAGQVVKVAYN